MRTYKFIMFMFMTLLSTVTVVAQDTDTTEPSDKEESLSLAGPRMGVVVFTSNIAKRIQDPTSTGGLHGQPVMSQFGYQFETAYISNEKVQALFEFVPIVTGMDQGRFMPSLSILHGIRLNKTGWEFIAGPMIFLSRRAEGFFDAENGNKWTSLTDYNAAFPGAKQPDNTIKMLDTRGDLGISTSFLISVGKNFRSGNLNFPVNVFAVPNPEGFRYGVSIGFNKQRYK